MNETKQDQDIIVAHPNHAQQLFVLLHDANGQPHNCLGLAQHLQNTFPHAVIIAAATPKVLLQEHNTNAALLQFLTYWWLATGLNATHTALICQGETAHQILYAASQPLLCARLFTVGNCIPYEAIKLPEHTTLHCLYPKGSSCPNTITQASEKLLQANIDCTLDALAQPCTYDTNAVQMRIVHLLQNHVPQRLWREAMRNIDTNP